MKAKDIDEYIAHAPKEAQSALKEIRELVKEEAPDAVETISYQMPTFKLNGKYLIYFAAWKDHIAIYPATSSLEVEKDLQEYRTGKGTFQFSLDKELPLSLIRKLVRIRMKDNEKQYGAK